MDGQRELTVIRKRETSRVSLQTQGAMLTKGASFRVQAEDVFDGCLVFLSAKTWSESFDRTGRNGRFDSLIARKNRALSGNTTWV